MNQPSPAGSAGFVRAARESDAPELARIQVASWRTDMAGIVPGDVFARLSSDEALKTWEARWHEAIASPPTSRHRVLVAVGPTALDRAVVGFASAGPATDPDLWPATDGQIYELRVLPERSGEGHAARLLHAVADMLAEDGFTTLSTWALEPDAAYREFLQSAGWVPDGAHGELDVGMGVSVMRLRTTIGEYGGEPE